MAKIEIPDDPTISVVEAGRILKVGRDASYAAAARGEIPTIKIGRLLRVPKAKFMRMLGLDDLPESDPLEDL